MGVAELLQLAGQFGPIGLLVAYLVYSEERREKRRSAERAERIVVDKETNEERAKLGSALTALCMVIQGRPHV